MFCVCLSVAYRNVTRSELTPLERNVTDFRHELCPRSYDLSRLPTVTVIIPFYNDALSMILRTVHSVLLRTPDQLLSQVIVCQRGVQRRSVAENCVSGKPPPGFELTGAS